MQNPFVQKLIWTVLAIGVYVLTVFVPEVGSDLKVIAGLIVGAVWINTKDSGRSSVRPPPSAGTLIPLFSHAAAMSIAFGALTACSQLPAPNDAAAEAAKMRASLAEVKGALDFAEPAIEMLCAIKPVEQCGTARDMLHTLAAAHDVAVGTLNTAESLGAVIGSREVAAALQQSKALGAAVLALGNEVARAVDQGPDRVAPAEPSGQPSASPAEVAAPADPGGARP